MDVCRSISTFHYSVTLTEVDVDNEGEPIIFQIFVFLYFISLIFISTTTRIGAMVKAMALQGVLLGFFALGMADYLGFGSLLFIVFETFIFKAIILPWLIAWIIRKNGIKREKEPSLTNFGNVFVTLVLIVGSLILAEFMGKYEPLLNPAVLGAAIGSVLVGLFIIVSWKKLITHILGYLVLENGIFLLSLSIMIHQPLMVNLGVLLDIFVGVFLMGLFMNHIHSTFEDIDVDDLNELRDE